MSTKPHPMQQFHDMQQHIIDNGSRQVNERTGEEVLFIPGYMMKFDMDDGFPAITTKQHFFKPAKGEFFGFARGYTSAQQFRDELGTKVWDDNANKTEAWLKNPARQGLDDLGRIYGAQWTDWRDWREANSQEAADALVAKGYEIRAHDKDRNVWVMRRGINQMEEALRTIMTKPSDRGIIVTGWRPDEFDQACLRPCHVDYQFTVDTTTKELHLALFQRSFDTCLGFNVSIGALFLHIMARLSGLKARSFTHFIGDSHVYVKHLADLTVQLSREHLPQPTLDLGNIPTLTSVDEIPGIFKRIDPDQVQLVGYQHQGKIAYEMTP